MNLRFESQWVRKWPWLSRICVFPFLFLAPFLIIILNWSEIWGEICKLYSAIWEMIIGDYIDLPEEKENNQWD